MTLVTNPDDCNLACDMCGCGVARAAGTAPRPPRRMDPALAGGVVRALAARGGLREVIPSTMGEPLLWDGLDALLDLCAALDLRVNLTTNGTWPGRGASAWADRLLPVASDVKVSWNAATPATAAAIMPGLDLARARVGVLTFAAARDGRVRRGGRRVTLSFQVTAQAANVAELPAIVALAGALGVDRVKVNQLQPRFPHLADRVLSATPAGIARWNAAVAEAREVATAAGVRLQGVERWPGDGPPRGAPGPCPFAGREAWVHADGAFAPCPHPAAREGALGAFGRVQGAGVGAIWDGAALAALVRGIDANPVCRGCPLRRPGGA